MLRWLHKRRPARAIPEPLWLEVLARFPFLTDRPASDLARLRLLALEFLAHKEFHGAHGFAISDTVALSIAAQAVLPILQLGEPDAPQSALRWYDDFVGIVVHPDEVVARREVADADGVVHHYSEVLSGEAMEGGPVMLSWKDVAAAGDSAQQGYNVVIHEFIHKIDMRDGQPDGCPPMPSRVQREAWLALLQAQFQSFREQVIIAQRFGGPQPWLDAYAAQDIGEFFAVACEAYFVNRTRFASDYLSLVALFDSFFIPSTPGRH